ncbi:MAG: three-Cys-motif partner protein TcmP [Methanobacterium sp.]
MSGVKGTLWEINQHTRAKHAILERYLQAWYPILSSAHKRINYIDGFAGPGEYASGEKGSPVIAIETAINHKLNLDSEISFLFIEKDNDRAEHLKTVLNRISMPDKFKHEVICGRFDDVIIHQLDQFEAKKEYLAPCFAFIDPFGYKDTPFTVIKCLMSFKRCEVLITFMSGFVNRFKNKDEFHEHLNLLFGTTNWKSEILNNDHDTIEKAIVEFYQNRLLGVAQYVRSFEMKSKYNQPIYRLVFATNDYEGLKKMKESMWKVDKTGQFTYCDTTDPDQTLLFKPQPEYNKLKEMLINKFGGKEASLKDIEKFVIIETPFRETHFKREILSKMEKANPPEIEVIKARPSRKKCTYPDEEMIIKFNSQTTQSSQVTNTTQSKSNSHTIDLSSFLKK